MTTTPEVPLTDDSIESSTPDPSVEPGGDSDGTDGGDSDGTDGGDSDGTDA